jgi:hypothetical protein
MRSAIHRVVEDRHVLLIINLILNAVVTVSVWRLFDWISPTALTFVCVFNTGYSNHLCTFGILKDSVSVCIQNGDSYVDSGGWSLCLSVPGKKKTKINFNVGLLIALITEAVSTSETSVNLYQTTQRNIPEDIFILAAVTAWNRTYYSISLRSILILSSVYM